jgi:hypothetical protein
MSMISPMPSVPTPNDGFIPSLQFIILPMMHTQPKFKMKMKNKMEVQKKMVMVNELCFFLLVVLNYVSFCWWS